MTFLWPELIFLLLLGPVVVAVYLRLLHRKKPVALRYSSIVTMKDAIGSSWRIRQHVPPLLFFAALNLMIVAIARPVTEFSLPFQHDTVVLAIDTSISMALDDVPPTRMESARAAIRRFVAEQPRHTRIGVVSFAGSASVVHPCFGNRNDIIAAIDQLYLQLGTAIGSAILASDDLQTPKATVYCPAPFLAAWRPASSRAPLPLKVGLVTSTATRQRFWTTLSELVRLSYAAP
jgi:Ca-activated chloride channel family protein